MEMFRKESLAYDYSLHSGEIGEKLASMCRHSKQHVCFVKNYNKLTSRSTHAQKHQSSVEHSGGSINDLAVRSDNSVC